MFGGNAGFGGAGGFGGYGGWRHVSPCSRDMLIRMFVSSGVDIYSEARAAHFTSTHNRTPGSNDRNVAQLLSSRV